ncbi:MAG TPA: NAD(P)/FAD-dependent oxidoreductase [Candidatus Limnocylindrales bacterium]|nr:NAD(P)/FAD-dependent oxidoreductase [Candidatus Limnocylindrales bacterium]
MTDIHSNQYDALIIGGGFAGLSAAIWLGRFHRSVLVISKGPTRNADSEVMHGYPGLDNCSPGELLQRMQTEAASYGAEFIEAWALNVKRNSNNFCIETNQGTYSGKHLLIATGTADVHPSFPGFEDCVGTSAWHCPACDGHEYTDKQIAIVGWHKDIVGYAEEFMVYTDPSNITIYIEGHDLPRKVLQQADEHNIRVVRQKIKKLRRSEGSLHTIELEDGSEQSADALFYNIEQKARLELFEQLGCELADGAVQVNQQQETSIKGVYAAGDITPFEDLVVVACSTGAIAASSIHEKLGTS